MQIRVRFADNQIREVPSRDLDRLIRSGQIVAFERSSGWIEVGSAPIRKGAAAVAEPEEKVKMAERRASQAYQQLLREVDKRDET